MIDTIRTFIKSEVAEITGLRPSLVQYYSDQKVIEPEENPSGRGTRRRYSKRNILEILIAKRFVEKGFSLEEAKTVIDWLKRTSDSSVYINLTELPKNLAKLKSIQKKFWDIDNWDNKYSVFILVEKKEKPISFNMQIINRGTTSKIEHKISDDTIFLTLVNVTDLIEKISKI
ncbi:MerR family transcriptional regulator [Thermodesulfobacteriota bacterium]